jgi:hypothetical protein
MTDWNTMPDVGAGRCVCGAPAVDMNPTQDGRLWLFCVKTGHPADETHDRSARRVNLLGPRFTPQRSLDYVRHNYREALREQEAQRQTQEPTL